MAFRNIIVESPAVISLRREQLIIRTDSDHSVAIEDISALLLESRQTTITTAALSRLGQCGCAVFICDEKHLPCAVLTPYQQHSRGLPVVRMQIAMTEPAKKRLWQSIVKTKILNQAICLHLTGHASQAETLRAMAERVRSGDSENVEAAAAQFYFPVLFGEGFTRGEDNGTNVRLNYGYAVLRGCIARYLAVYGFLPSLGLHHRSTLNAFNLADDLIEPFRPVVDLLVVRSITEDEELSPPQKRLLFNCLNLDILSGKQHHSVSYAIERLVQSLSRSAERPEAGLILPTLLETEQHRYE